MTLEEINARLKEAAQELGLKIACCAVQPRGRARLMRLHEWREWADGVLVNAAAYTHTSVALRDAIAAVGIPTVEVHLSNVYAREAFRHQCAHCSRVCGTDQRFGWRSYLLGLTALLGILEDSLKEGST